MFLNLSSRLLLAFILVFSSAPFQLSPVNTAYAQDSNDNNSSENEKTTDDEINELKRAFLNPESNTAALDPFGLTSQTLIDDRSENVDAVIKESIAQDYRERVEYFENEISELDDLKAQIEMKLQNEEKPERTAELQAGLSDIESRKQIAQIELKDLEAFDPSKGNSLKLDHMVDTDLRTRHYYGRNLKILLSSEDSKEPKTISQKDFTQSLSPGTDIKNPVESPSIFEIATPKGLVMHKFLRPVEALFFYGQYLVYVEKDSYDKKSGVQDVKFIDLKYFRVNIGNAPLPVFTLPLKADAQAESYTVENGYLKIGDQKLSHPQIDVLAKTQRVVFNVNAALVDPSTYDNARPLIDEIGNFFATSMKGQESLFQDQMTKALSTDGLLDQVSKNLKETTSMDYDASKILIAKALEDKKITDAEYEKIKTALDAGIDLKASNTALHASRKLMTRINLLIRFLMKPRPEGAPKVFRALLIAATKGKEERARILEFTKNSLGYKVAKYGAAAGGTLLAAATLSPFVRDQLTQSLDLISAVHQHYIGYLQHIDYGRHYVELSKDAVVTSVTGWTYVFESYLSDGKWSKFLYGLGSVLMIPITLFSTIHFVVNTVKMAFRTKSYRATLTPETRVGFVRSFINAAALENKAYWDNRADAEKKVSGSDVSDMSDEDLKLLDEHLERLKSDKTDLRSAKEDLGIIKKSALKRFKMGFGSAVAKSKSILSYVNFVQKLVTKLTSKLSLKNEESFLKGLANAFLSYSALTSTFKINSTIWNILYVARSFAFSPSKWLMWVVYPNYFSRAVSQESKKQHFPSKFNGGLELWTQKIRRMPLPGFAKKPFRGFFISKESLANLRKFEGEVSKIEVAAMELSFKRAQIALMENIDDPDKIMAIFDSATRPGEVTTGIRSLHDDKIKALSKKDRLFFRAYYTRTFDLAMQSFILKISSTQIDANTDPEAFAKAFAKELKNNPDLNVDLSENRIADVKTSIESSLDFSAIGAWANSVASGGDSVLKKLNINYRHNLLGSIHPSNGQIRRFLTAKEKVKDPRAMARATREEVTSLVSSIPIGILSTLGLYAGVQTGVLQPFDAAGLNTETHYLYMSKYLFYNGFIPGVIIGLMANTWFKVQTDARIDDLGGFDKAIKFSDSKKGFWRYYVKNFFKHPANKWKANQLHMLGLIWSNIPAAAVTLLVAQTYGLGRIDPGIILSGYVMIFASVLVGLNVKTNQAFELATSWVFDKIPRKFRAHPKAQKYIELQTQKRRIFFGWFENLWEIIVQENIAGDMLTLKDNPRMGTRSFFRLMFGGDTPTEIIVNFADKLKLTFVAIPGVETVLEAFKKAVSNGFEAFERYPERLPDVPEKLTENPDLPKSFFGELLGKASGMLVTIGIFSGTPYVVADQVERISEKRIQKKGIKIKASGAMSCSAFL